MLLLCLDTATSQVSAAIGADGAVLGEVRLGRGRRHAEHLAPAIEYLCRELDVELARLSAIAVGLGPGLFTGLRVGVTTAKMLARSVNTPKEEEAIDALRDFAEDVIDGEAFMTDPDDVLDHLERVTDYEVGAPADLVADLVAAGDDVLLAGDGALGYREELAEVDHSEQAGPSYAFPSAAALVELATARVEREDFVSPEAVQPLYLRRSDAEIEWKRREAS